MGSWLSAPHGRCRWLGPASFPGRVSSGWGHAGHQGRRPEGRCAGGFGDVLRRGMGVASLHLCFSRRRVRPWSGGLVWWGHRGVPPTALCVASLSTGRAVSVASGFGAGGVRTQGRVAPRSQPGAELGPALRPHGGCRELVSCLCLRCAGKYTL